ncbi:hypothetical protein FLL45_06890 [Aliikangiella marina]|uniref:Uncharacterized protein n=1 Tax=Aliikangiella marina TaxID=1712262 RepID=A0A545TBU1_9GAMM|nr:hypothetical protein [Aliikangiella marina]TQV74680.1 hypothetical protein FLL45_06890 [Aliikangiella marina]
MGPDSYAVITFSRSSSFNSIPRFDDNFDSGTWITQESPTTQVVFAGDTVIPSDTLKPTSFCQFTSEPLLTSSDPLQITNLVG